MFDIGGGEFILISILALILIPPKKLPQAATGIGRFLAQLQRGFKEVTNNFESGLKDININPPTSKPFTTFTQITPPFDSTPKNSQTTIPVTPIQTTEVKDVKSEPKQS